jgi:phosphoglycerate dehydrogenase-like enzyme
MSIPSSGNSRGERWAWSASAGSAGSPAAIEAQGGKPATVQQIAENADVIVLCAAESKSTRHVFPASAVEAMKPMTVLVNISRASLIDMDALAARLKKGDLIAMLDVFLTEPLPLDSELRKLPNTYLTPHRAGGLMQSVERAIDWLTGDLVAFLENKPRKYAVTEAMLPSFAD